MMLLLLPSRIFYFSTSRMDIPLLSIVEDPPDNEKNIKMMSHNYKNILSDLGGDCSDFKWISRTINFIETFKQERPKLSPNELKLLVYNSNRMQETIKKIFNDNNKNIIYNILSEIGFAYDLSVIRWLGYILVKILRSSLSGLFVNEDQLTKIRNEMGSSPVVFVPTHRSYGDFILMAFVCFKYNINIPCVAAGMDFLSMKFMNKILRKSKAFFMRRKFSDDPLYRNVFKEYIKILISYQNSPVEFFIEGTRSRTGKSLMPKFGFLTMLAEAFILGDIPDIKIIPVNISYDRILEENLFAYELMGIPKPKESTIGLVKGLRVMKGNYGNVFINFGEPITIREFFHEVEDYRFLSTNYETLKIKEIAYKIIEVQQSLQVFGCFNLLSLIMNSNYHKTRSYSISLQDAIKQFKWLLYLYEQFGAAVWIGDDIESSIKETVDVHNSVIECNDNYIHLKSVNEVPVHTSSNEYLMTCVPYVILQIYINPSLNLFIRASIVISILNKINTKLASSKDVLLKNYQYMCNLLKYEFILDSREKEFAACVSRLKKLQLLDIGPNSINLLTDSELKDFFLELLHPFITGLHFICLFFKKFQNAICQKSHQEIKKMIQSHIEGNIREGLIPYHYCATVDFISNTFNSFQEIGIISVNEMKNQCQVENRPLKVAIEFTDCLSNREGCLDQQTNSFVYENIHAKL